MQQQATAQVLAFHTSRQGADRIRELVGSAPLAQLTGLESSAQDFERKAVKMQPDVLLVEYSPEREGLLDLLERLRRTAPRAAVVALSATKEPDDILAAMRAGVREFLAEPAPLDSFNEAVLRLKRAVQSAGVPSGKMLAVLGVKGGVGATSLALNMAWCLSQQGGELVALVDLDLASGDLAYMADMSPKRDMSDVARNFDRMDSVMLDGMLTELAPSLRLLPAPLDPVAAEEVGAEHVARALDHICDTHSVAILDLPARLDEVGLMALDRCNKAILVTEPTVPGLRAAQRMITLADRLGHPQSKLGVVVNRQGIKGGLRKREVDQILGREVEAYLPDDSRFLMAAANAGSPVLRERPRAPWSKAVNRLTLKILGEMEVEQ